MIIKIGIAGFGKVGKIRANEIFKNKNTKLISVFDNNKEALDSCKNYDVEICDTFDSLLKSDIDAVFICAFNNVLADYTSKALKSGKHVFCEKPPARSTNEL